MFSFHVTKLCIFTKYTQFRTVVRKLGTKKCTAEKLEYNTKN
jgi:hypothetical protein